jgi:hypothetical protein
MGNQRGYTLVEALAALTIAMLVFGAAFLLFSSMNRMADNRTHAYMDRSSLNRTMNTIADRLNDSIAAFYLEAVDELRFSDGVRAWSLWFDPSEHTLTLYEFAAGADGSLLRDSAVSYITNPALYSNGVVLSGIVRDVRYLDEEDIPLSDGVVLAGGDYVKVEAVFRFTGSTRGAANPAERPESVLVKLMEDQTNK